MSLIFWRSAKVSSTGSRRWSLTKPELDHLEECIAEVRSALPKDAAQALDGLAFVAGEVMDLAAKDWEDLVGRKWERYVD